jgi:hypothetical protein
LCFLFLGMDSDAVYSALSVHSFRPTHCYPIHFRLCLHTPNRLDSTHSTMLDISANALIGSAGERVLRRSVGLRYSVRDKSQS